MTHMTDTRVSGQSLVARIFDVRDALSTRISQYRVYRTTLAELRNLSARELNDLGLRRETLRTIAHEAAYS